MKLVSVSGTLRDFIAGGKDRPVKELLDDPRFEVSFKEAVLSEPTYLLSEHTGAMVALHIPPNVAQQLALPNGLTPEEMHVTLVYMGEPNGLDHDTVDRIITDFANSHGPFEGKVAGLGRFTGGEKDVVYASVDSPDLPEFRQDLAKALALSGGEHGFIPHITLSYISPSDPLPIERVPNLALRFESIFLHWGDEVKEYVLKET